MNTIEEKIKALRTRLDNQMIDINHLKEQIKEHQKLADKTSGQLLRAVRERNKIEAMGAP